MYNADGQKLLMDYMNFPIEDRLKFLDLYSVRGRYLRADIIKCWKIFHGFSPIAPDQLFVLAPDVGT